MSCSPTRLPSLSIRELTIYTKNEQPSPSPTQNISHLSSVTVQCCTVLLAHTRPTVFYKNCNQSTGQCGAAHSRPNCTIGIPVLF